VHNVSERPAESDRGAGWSGALRRPESKVTEESFELAPKTVSGDTTTNGQRKGVPNSWSGNSEAARTETCPRLPVSNKIA